MVEGSARGRPRTSVGPTGELWPREGAAELDSVKEVVDNVCNIYAPCKSLSYTSRPRPPEVEVI